MGQDEQRRADLAEKLRRSLEDRPAEADNSAVAQDEELRALLRARLEKEQRGTSSSAESEYVMVDLDEFEEDDSDEYEDVEIFEESVEDEDVLDEEEILDEEEALDEEEDFDEAQVTIPFGPAEPISRSDTDSDKSGEIVSDDLVNGQSLDGLLSGAFMELLDEDTRRRLQRMPAQAMGDDSAWDDAQMTLAMPIMSSDKDDLLSAEATAEDDSDSGSDSDIDIDRRSTDGLRRAAEPCDPMQMGFEATDRDGRRAVDILDELGIPTYTPAKTSTASDETYRVVDETSERNMATEMYLRMGYGSELDSPTRRYESSASDVERIRGEQLASDPVGTRNATDAVAPESTALDPDDTAAWDGRYARARLFAIVRLAIVAVCAVFMTLYDILPYMARGGDAELESFVGSAWYPVCGIILLLVCASPAWTRLWRGARSLWDFSPVGYAVPAVSIVVAVAHAIVACLVSAADRALPLFGGAALLSLSLAALAELLSVIAEKDAFGVASSGKTKYVLDVATDDVADAALDGSGSDADVCLRVHRTAHVSDYFRWVNRYDEGLSRLNYLLPVALVGAILCGGVTALIGGELGADAVCAFTATMMCMLPVSFSLSFSLPLMLANKQVTKRGSAVLGEAASDAYAFGDKRRAHIVWHDGDALKATEQKEITLRGDADADRYRTLAKKLFLVIDNALAEENTDGVFDDVDGYGVEIAESSDGFVRLYLIDDVRREATEVMMGTHDGLTRHGVRLPKANMERVYKRTERSQVVYIAFDGQFRLAYAVEYRTKRSFISGINCLSEMGIGSSVASCDPLVKNGSMMIPQSGGGMMPVGVVRPTRADGTHRVRESGVIATGRAMNLAYPLMACRRVKRARRLGVLTSVLSTVMSFVAIAALAALELTATVQPWAVMLWMLMTAGVVSLTSLLSVRERHLQIPDVRRASQPKDI